MSLFGLSVVKNEADVIEAMIRHNLAYLDHIHVIDNVSYDGTIQILEKLVGEGLSLSISTDSSLGHNQSAILTNFIRNSTHLTNTACVVLLDGDEFIKSTPDRFKVILENSSEPISIPWVTYIPTPTDKIEILNPAVRIVNRRRVERPQYYKVTVPSRCYRSVTVAPGSHFISAKGERITANPVDEIQFAHFPVRSSEQLIAKVLLGDWSVRLRDNAQGEAYHWKELADRVRNGEPVSEYNLSEIANGYAARRTVRLVNDPLDQFNEVTLMYTEMNKINLLENIIGFTEQLIVQIEASRSQNIEKFGPTL